MRILLSQRCLNRTGSGPRSDPPSRVGFSHARTSSGGRTEVSNVFAGARVARRRTRAIITTAAALSATAALAAPAGAAVTGTHVIAVLPSTSGLELTAYPKTTLLDVSLVRNGVTIAHGTVLTDDVGDGAVNGGG